MTRPILSSSWVESVAGGLQSYLEPLVRLVLADLAQQVSAGLADAACRRQHSLSGLQTHTDADSHAGVKVHRGAWVENLHPQVGTYWKITTAARCCWSTELCNNAALQHISALKLN